MASTLPTALKIPEVSRFVNRAAQLRSVKPAIAYWCEYRAVNQIVGKSLHTSDDDAFAYTKTLIDRLEATKVEHADDESIVDNEVAKAYVEQFAQQTFDRAERTMLADKVTRQTADTFDAAATFFELLREWGELEAEVLQKIKFAKWNAARILKAIREGRDPNETNPKQPEKEETEQDPAAALQLDSNDPDVQDITTGVPPQPASVQDIPDAGEPLGTAGLSRQPPSVPEDYFPSGLQLSPGPPPLVPDGMPPSVPTTLPGAPPEDPVSASSQIPLQPSPQIPTKLPSQFSPPVDTAPPPPTFDVPPPVAPVVPAAAPPPPQPTAPVPPPAQSIPPPAAPPPATNVHHKDLNQAQKHAKWAISALNFEDVPTAVQELRNALAALGTQ